MTATSLAEFEVVDLPPLALALSLGLADACPECGHSDSSHKEILSSGRVRVICHEFTLRGECFRARLSAGIPFGACGRCLP